MQRAHREHGNPNSRLGRCSCSDCRAATLPDCQCGRLSSDLLSCNTFAEFKEAAERAFIIQKLRENDWNVSETARILDMPRSNLYKKIERYELVREG